MARTRTTKGVAQRIDLNYFKRPTPFKRAKLWLAIVAPAIALVWIGWHVFGHDNRVYSSGRLSKTHAVLEKQCAACHVQQTGGFSAAAADSACLACHDGPPHHASNVNARISCAECHVEHRGRVSLIATKNQSCAQCHGDLVIANRDSSYAKHIQSFEDGHPEFAVLRVADGGAAHDPGTIKLNHALHMKAIRQSPTGPMVQLDCGDCHKTGDETQPSWRFADSTYRLAEPQVPLQSQHAYDFRDEFLQPKSRGLMAARPDSGRALMAPPKFESTCAGCHQLTFDKRFDQGVPHDTPQVIHEYLMKCFAKYIATHPEELHEVQDPRRNLTGRVNGPAVRSLSTGQWVAERVAVAEELLWHKTCSQCHAISGSTLQDVRIARWDAGNSREPVSKIAVGISATDAWRMAVSLPAVTPASITLQWLPHARFDHDAHTGFSCAGCHANALTSTQESDILIPGIATCQKCHAPGAGFAESRCFECHTYHDWAKRKEVRPTFVLPALELRGN